MPSRTAFEYELKELKSSVSKMGAQVENFYNALFFYLDHQNREEVCNIMKTDRRISDMERDIESRCLSLITRQQPVARDLRTVSASLKVVTDIQRIGGHVSDIVELLLRLNLNRLDTYSRHLIPMRDATEGMVHASVKAFIARAPEAAKAVIGEDDTVDDLFNKVKNDLVDCLKKESRNADECVDILMIAKYFEKIADHAVNIAQWEIFQETGDIGDVRVL